MSFSDVYDPLVLGLAAAGAATVFVGTHQDLCFGHTVHTARPQVDTDEDIESEGTGPVFFNFPHVLEMLLFAIGWTLVTLAAHFTVDDLQRTSSRDNKSLQAWAYTGTAGVPVFALLPSLLGGASRSRTCPIPKAIFGLLYFCAWTVLGTFAAHDKDGHFAVFGYVAGPAAGLSFLVIWMARHRRGTALKVVRWVSSAFMLAAWVLFVIALSRRPGL